MPHFATGPGAGDEKKTQKIAGKPLLSQKRFPRTPSENRLESYIISVPIGYFLPAAFLFYPGRHKKIAHGHIISRMVFGWAREGAFDSKASSRIIFH